MQTTAVVEEEHTLSVAELIREAMETSQGYRPSIETPRDLPAPQPYLPLRKASTKRLQSKQSAPRPLWAPSQHQLRGFNPSPVQALPHIDNITASSEHAFAGRDENRRRGSRLPLGVQAMKHGQDSLVHDIERPSSSQVDGIGSPPLSPLISPPGSPRGRQTTLRSSKSLGGLRGWKHRFSSPGRRAMPADRDTTYSVPIRPSIASTEARESTRSIVTTNSSFFNASSINTAHSSLNGGNSSSSDFVQVYPNWPQTQEVDEDGGMTVEDAIGMYADGFSSAKPSLDTAGKRSFQGADTHSRSSSNAGRPFSQPTEKPISAKRPNISHRRSQSASLLDRVQNFSGEGPAHSHSPNADHKQTYIVASAKPATLNGQPPEMTLDTPRDRYGFKKVSHYITVEQYDAWNVQYSEHLERRRKKWHALMKSYGLSTDKPFRFPPKSDKIKRYVRKGMPPEFRGAAWFWYAGGPGIMAKEPGLYWNLLERAKNGELSENDKEHIERDLNRTFPDNIRFKPDPTTTADAQAGAGGGTAKRKSARYSTDPETPILQSLRRVLQALAVHNPMIGYCQSMNFIAGLLLLFLNGDEEKAFILLNIVTTTHLPGTHGVALEGANIDIAVLMSCIKDSLPAIWARLDDKGGAMAPAFPSVSAQALRLPTVSLATTAWFMSLFVGTLPIESVLRVWDCLFFEGSKTLFRIALAIFKRGETQILAVNDPMEIFQVVQTIPRGMLDINGLMEVCFRRRGGFGHVSQGLIESRRDERRQAVRDGVSTLEPKSVWKGRWRAKTRG